MNNDEPVPSGPVRYETDPTDHLRLPIIDNIINLHEQLTPLVMYARVGEKNWRSLITTVGKWRLGKLEFVQAFLVSLRDTEWKALDAARRQMCATDDMWENMELFFEHEAFPEQAVVNRARNALKNRWLSFKVDYAAFKARDK